MLIFYFCRNKPVLLAGLYILFWLPALWGGSLEDPLALVVGGHAVNWTIFGLLALPLILCRTHSGLRIPKWFFLRLLSPPTWRPSPWWGGIFRPAPYQPGPRSAFPYSLLCLGMRANNPQMALPLPPSGGLRVLPSALLSAGRTAALPPGCRHRVKHTPACHSTRGYVLPPIEKVLSTAGGL